jgi:signal transduction histidine kinase
VTDIPGCISEEKIGRNSSAVAAAAGHLRDDLPAVKSPADEYPRPKQAASSRSPPGRDANDARSVASSVRLRVLLPLAGAMLLLLMIFVSVFIAETRHRQAEDIARTTTSVDALFREQSAAGIQVVRSIMELVLLDRQLEGALRARDRQQLLDLSTPLLNAIRARNHITHFYYILPDRTMLLRVQAPDQHGDRIDRFVLQEAQRTGKPFWGNEQGPLGSFTLRVVYPWISNGEVIGYLEMGIEFEDIMQSLKSVLDVDAFVVVEKSYFDRAKWDQAQSKRERPVPWDEFPSVVVLSRTTLAIPEPIKTYLGELNAQHSKRSFEIAWDGQVAQTIVVPFANLRGQELGELVVVRDITAGAAERRQAVIAVALLATLTGGALMLFFYVLLGRAQRDVAERTERLSEAQRVLTLEQLERQRAERELGLQQERNELLEARSRMVEELAAAKEAAEAALRDNEKITLVLRDAQAELVTTARRAGMAEIATNVLHNVGNVLNSVNISAGVVSGQVRASKSPGLTRAVQLMNEHAADLGDFLTRDPKGKLLPDYLSKLAEALAVEQTGMMAELGQLTNSVEHIKDIVATQQSYAGGAGSVVAPVQIRELVEDALRMNACALTRHEVTVVKELAEVPPLPLDRHRVLQILINLISNAKQAMSGVGGQSNRMTLRVGETDLATGRCLRISVEDDGEGIPADNMTRIFVHGFTTRVNGHGFGLHSCALAAREMGGRLTAHSDGPGLGAIFTLELPVETPKGT